MGVLRGRGLMRRAVMVSTLVPLLTALAGCGGDEREYALPEQLCGVEVRSERLGEILPPGKEIHQERSSFGASDGLEGCMVSVDDNVELTSTGKWRKAGLNAKEATSYPGPTIVAGGKYAVWDRGAATVLQCRAPDKEIVSADGGGKGSAEIFSIEVKVTEEATEEAMQKFIASYAKAYRQTLPCQDS